jgi:hypothetical protein
MAPLFKTIGATISLAKRRKTRFTIIKTSRRARVALCFNLPNGDFTNEEQCDPVL